MVGMPNAARKYLSVFSQNLAQNFMFIAFPKDNTVIIHYDLVNLQVMLSKDYYLCYNI